MKIQLDSIPIPNGSLSTILGARLSARYIDRMQSVPFDVSLSDGSILTGEIDHPCSDEPKANILLVHGLGSSCHDPSVVRQARHLAKAGYKVFRLNHRNIGSGRGKAHGFYHGFRGSDLKDAMAHLQASEPNMKWILIGHSMSGNMVMKIAGTQEHSETLKSLGCVGFIAVSPVIDLKSSSVNMHKPMFGLFNKVFLKKIGSYLKRLEHVDDSLRQAALSAKRLSEFDEVFLAPALGLSNANQYYSIASSQDVLEHIDLPTEVFLSKDDPIAPGTCELLEKVNNPRIRLHAFRFGGHLGFVQYDMRKRRFRFPIDRLISHSCDRILTIR